MQRNESIWSLPGILVDASDQAKSLNLEGSVAITYGATKELKPSGFLQDLGISLESRITNLLRLVKARLSPANDSQRFVISLCIAQGPVIREQIVDFYVTVESNDSSESSIIISTTASE